MIGGYKLLLEKIGGGSRVGGFSTSLGPRYIPVNTPYGVIWKVALLPVVIEAYDTPVFTTEILISFMLCGLSLRRFAKPFVLEVMPCTLCFKGVLLLRRLFDISGFL